MTSSTNLYSNPMENVLSGSITHIVLVNTKHHIDTFLDRVKTSFWGPKTDLVGLCKKTLHYELNVEL